MTTLRRIVLALTFGLIACVGAKAIGWPANYQGVMLQGFYWDSYQSETKWNKIEALADEYSKYFSLIWVPNSAKSSGGLGYMPVYWFTNHNSSMGSEAQLRSMIKTYKEKGVGFIGDVVINHRAGVSNWTNFPSETWNGQTWKIGPEGICCDDEVAGQSGQAKPTGAKDTGDGYEAARDLDHTNANVQNNCKNYMLCLLQEWGYVGFRLDYCKGFSGQYIKTYNQYAKPTYCVGEYWDGSYDALARWIESTGKESAAFDFAFKYAVNKAFANNNMMELAWAAGGDNNNKQPAGLIHYGYQQLAVTFIDNHDTSRDSNKFSGNVVAANAFMLCSPGTPCVFLPHWNQYKSEIGKLINIRNSCGVTNTSRVKVLQSSRDCYMAEVYGNKGTLVVKIGSAMASPSGYSDSDIKASGNGYCVWTKNSVNGDPPTPTPNTYPANLYMVGHVNGGKWGTTPDKVVAQSSVKDGVYTWNSVTINDGDEGAGLGYFSFITATGSDWDSEVNASDRYGATAKDFKIAVGTTADVELFAAGVNASSANSWAIAPGNYKVTVNLQTMKITISEVGSVDPNPNPNPDPDPDPNPGNYPSPMYLVGHVNGGAWGTTPDCVVARTPVNGVYTYDNVTLDDAGGGLGYFSFITATGSDWDSEVNVYDRYGAASDDEAITIGKSHDIVLYAAGVNASAASSWAITPGLYTVKADLKTMKLTVTNSVGVEFIINDIDPDAEYFNLQGVKVEKPANGVFIMRKGASSIKVYIK